MKTTRRALVVLLALLAGCSSVPEGEVEASYGYRLGLDTRKAPRPVFAAPLPDQLDWVTIQLSGGFGTPPASTSQTATTSGAPRPHSTTGAPPR